MWLSLTYISAYSIPEFPEIASLVHTLYVHVVQHEQVN